jgi:hypothetical protein
MSVKQVIRWDDVPVPDDPSADTTGTISQSDTIPSSDLTHTDSRQMGEVGPHSQVLVRLSARVQASYIH